MTVISICQKCRGTIIVNVSDGEYTHGLKYLCSECADNSNGLIIDDKDVTNLSAAGTNTNTGAIVPYAGGFKNGTVYESEEEKALKDLKRFCIY